MTDSKDINKLIVKLAKFGKKKPKLLLTKGFGCENSKTIFFLHETLFRIDVNNNSILSCFQRVKNEHIASDFSVDLLTIYQHLMLY